MISDDIHSKYSVLFKNTDSHLKAIDHGILEFDYERIENIFGQAPDDYIINGVLNTYHKYSKKDGKLNWKWITCILITYVDQFTRLV